MKRRHVSETSVSERGPLISLILLRGDGAERLLMEQPGLTLLSG